MNLMTLDERGVTREQIKAFRFSFEGILRTQELNLWEKSEAKIWLYLNLEYLIE